MGYKVTVMVTINCIVCHLKKALFILGKVKFNVNIFLIPSNLQITDVLRIVNNVYISLYVCL